MSIWENIKKYIYWVFVIAVISFMIFLVYVGFYTDANAEYELIGTKQIYSTNLQQQTSGEYSGVFFISSGKIEDKIVYYIYVQSEKGMKLQSFESDSVELVETNKCQPKIETYQRISPEDRKFIVYVPTGTIKNNFNIEVKP